MKNLLISFSLVFTLISFTAANASDLGDFGNFFDEVWAEMKNAYSGTDGRDYVDEMGRHHYEGPNYSYRVPTSTIRPFSARGPSIKAGCTGIDIDMGAFEFIDDPERLVQFLKDVVAGSPGYSFNLAMQTFCPQCTELLNKLNSLANMINGIQMDSCGVLNAAGTMGSGIMREKFGIDAKEGKDNAFNDFIGNVTKDLGSFEEAAKGYIQGFLCATGSGTNCPIRWLDPDYVKAHNATLLSTMLNKSVLKGMGLVEEDEATDFEKLIRGFVGDLRYIPGQTDSNGKASQPTTQYVPPSFSSSLGTLNDALDIWIGKKDGVNSKMEIYLTDRDDTAALYTIDDDDSLGRIAHEFLNKIRDAYSNRTAIDNTTLAFLQTFPVPVYKIINSISVEPSLMESYLVLFENLSAKQFAYEIFLSISRDCRILINDSENAIVASKTLADDRYTLNNIGRLNENVKNLTQLTYEAYVNAYAEFNEGLAKLNGTQQFQYRMQAQMARHPLYGSYLLGKGLALQ